MTHRSTVSSPPETLETKRRPGGALEGDEGAAPSGGLAAPLGNSEVADGPPSAT